MLLAVLRQQAAVSWSRDLFFSLYGVPKGTVHSVGTLTDQETQQKVRKSVLASRGRGAKWNIKTNELARPFAKLMYAYSYRPAT